MLLRSAWLPSSLAPKPNYRPPALHRPIPRGALLLQLSLHVCGPWLTGSSSTGVVFIVVVGFGLRCGFSLSLSTYSAARSPPAPPRILPLRPTPPATAPTYSVQERCGDTSLPVVRALPRGAAEGIHGRTLSGSGCECVGAWWGDSSSSPPPPAPPPPPPRLPASRYLLVGALPLPPRPCTPRPVPLRLRRVPARFR
ncbi:hypothetical protein B0H13DRAFT_2302196 [Mycena leptocephala]|nr:hypothetical protein B0H13DRAFT_2302196 [Mycena leptocephala]